MDKFQSVRRIRVMHVALQLDTGGMEKLLVEFARHSDRDRFDLQFLSLGGRGTVAGDIDACGCPITALHAPDGLRPQLIIRIASIIRRSGADVIHTHNTKPLIYAGPAARLAGARLVIHTRHGQRFGAGKGETLLFRMAASLVDRFVCVSKDSAHLSISDGIPASRVTAIWNGIDIHRFAYAGPCMGGSVVMVGRLSPEKDVATLLRAFAIACRLEPSLRLEIAGDGQCRPELERLAEELGLRSCVRFLGEVSDIPGLLSRCRLFVLPSLTEGVSLTLLEAMARGLPIVATKVGGNPEVVIDGETGILIPPEAPNLLAEAILKLWRCPDLCYAFGQSGRNRVEKFFDIRTMVSRYEDLYLKVNKRNGRAISESRVVTTGDD